MYIILRDFEYLDRSQWQKRVSRGNCAAMYAKVPVSSPTPQNEIGNVLVDDIELRVYFYLFIYYCCCSVFIFFVFFFFVAHPTTTI